MAHFSPSLDTITQPSERTYETCDSPSGSSTSEPHDETMHIPPELIDQSFFQKLDHLSPDNPLYFMSSQGQNQPQQSQPLDDDMMFDGTPETDTMAHIDSTTPMSFLQSLPSSVATSPQPMSAAYVQSPSNTSSVIQPLQPSTCSVSSSGTSPTFWSGFNNFFAQVANNPFPQAFPNLARNFADYLPTYPPLSGSLNPGPSTQATTPGVSAAAPAAFPVLPQTTFKQENAQGQRAPKSEGMQIRVLGVPQTGAKSRVETQIKLCIQLVTDDGDKAQWWTHLKLPEYMVAKDKLKRQMMPAPGIPGVGGTTAGLDSNNLPIQPEKMLHLSARVICASDPSRKVVTCLGCIQRERKRSQRRKENRAKTETDDEGRHGEDEKSLALEEQKVLLFNCSEIVDFSSGDTILPTRITCYCRHHNERLGFCIYFEMHDHTGRRVATGISPPIMITDDHKSNKQKAGRKRPRTDNDKLGSQAMLAPGSAPVSVSGMVPLTLQQQQLQKQHQQQQPIPQTTLLPPAPLERSQLQRLASTDTLAYGGGVEFATLGVGVSQQQQQQQQPAPAAERPQIQRLIPTEGPTYGGIEVTVLGTGFRPGLTCLFGGVPATDTHYWSPNTLVCILPPAAEAGTVAVSVKGHSMMVDSQDVMMFTYFDENDRALMELALQVVGLKMTGKVEDAREIAMRIVQGGNESQHMTSQPAPEGGQRQANLERQIIQVLQVMETMENVKPQDVSVTNPQKHTLLHLASMLGFETLVRTLLELGCNVDAVDRNRFTALHYASWFGYDHIVRILLEEGGGDPEIYNVHHKRAEDLAKDDATRNVFVNHALFDQDDKVASIQYLDIDDDEYTSSDEILDAEPVHHRESKGDLSSDEEQDPQKQDSLTLPNWMQRTLSHFQQQKPQRTTPGTPTDTSFLQNLKNSMPNKATDLSLKTVADHLLQLPRPASMIANMSVLFSNEPSVASSGGPNAMKRGGSEEPEQTLAWYMALAYAMGARNSSGNLEGTSSRPNRKQHHSSVYTPATMSSAAGPSSAASTSYDSYYPGGLETMTDRKRGDNTLFTVWVPLLCLALFWLLYQFTTWIGRAPSLTFGIL